MEEGLFHGTMLVQRHFTWSDDQIKSPDSYYLFPDGVKDGILVPWLADLQEQRFCFGDNKLTFALEQRLTILQHISTRRQKTKQFSNAQFTRWLRSKKAIHRLPKIAIFSKCQEKKIVYSRTCRVESCITKNTILMTSSRCIVRHQYTQEKVTRSVAYSR